MTFSRLVGVVGAGLMGGGIAAQFASTNFEVLVHDSSATALEGLRKNCAVILQELVEGGVFTPSQASAALSRIHVTERLEDLAATDFVVEAIVESAEAKQRLYARLEAVVGAATVIASSTSGFPPDELAKFMSRPERFVVAHFWNPPHLIPLVEVLAGAHTDKAVTDATVDLMQQCGCRPVILKKAAPGFIGNRFQFAVLREALHLLQEGIADAETIDLVMRESLGRRYRWIGPLEGADLGGLGTFLAIATELMPTLAKGEDVLDMLRAHVARDERGRATGRGIYPWTPERELQYRKARLNMLHDAQAGAPAHSALS